MADRRPRYNAVVASAARVDSQTARVFQADNRPWQNDGWRFYDTSGELRSGITWQANAASRVRLLAATPAEKPGDEPTPVESGPAYDLMEQLAGGVGGQSDLLSTCAVNLAVPGECYLIGYNPAETGETELDVDGNGQVWQIRSKDEVKIRKNGAIEIKVDDGGRWRRLSDESMAVRIWRPHKRYQWLADSPVRAALPILTELELLNRHIVSSARSRLAGAGILFVPQEMSFPVKKDQPTNPDVEPFIAELMDAMLTPVSDPGSASGVVPMVVRAAKDQIEGVLHLRFDTPFDERVLELREAAIRRLAIALDMPPEAMTGVGDVNHWTAWQIGEEGLKLHLDPMIETIANAVTIGYLRPMLQEVGADDEAIVWYDTTELQTRPDRTETSIQLLDRFIIDPEAAIREAGLEEADVPDEATLRQMAAYVALKSPETFDKGLALLNIEQPGAPVVPAGPAPPAPEQPDVPQIGPPDTQTDAPPESIAAAGFTHLEGLVEACDSLMERAFEKAGNRLRSWTIKDRQAGRLDLSTCAARDTHCRISSFQFSRVGSLFDDAWERVPDIAKRYDVDERCLQETLAAHAWGLVGSQSPHRRHDLAIRLEIGCCWEPDRAA